MDEAVLAVELAEPMPLSKSPESRLDSEDEAPFTVRESAIFSIIDGGCFPSNESEVYCFLAKMEERGVVYRRCRDGEAVVEVKVCCGREQHTMLTTL